MMEDANVEKYTMQLSGYYERARNDMQTLSSKIDNFIKKAGKAKSHIQKNEKSNDKINKLEFLIAASSQLKSKIDDGIIFFSDEDNLALLNKAIKPIAYYYEQDSKGILFAIFQRLPVVIGALVTCVLFLIYTNYQKLIFPPSILYIFSFPLIALLFSMGWGHRRRSNFVERAKQRVVDALSASLGSPTTPAQLLPRKLGPDWNRSSTLSLINEIEASGEPPQPAPGSDVSSRHSAPHRLDISGLYYDDPGVSTPFHQSKRILATVLWALLFLSAPEIFARVSFYVSGAGQAHEKLFLARSSGREACALARGRVFLQTPSTLFVRTERNADKPEIRLIKRDEIVETLYGPHAERSAAIKDCETVHDLYKTEIAPTTVTAPNVFNFLPPERSAAAPGAISPSAASAAKTKRTIIIPFLVAPVANDLKRAGKYDPEAAYLHGFKSVLAGHKDDQIAREAVRTLHEAFDACGQAGGRVTIDAVGYASNRQFDGTTLQEHEMLNHFLSEGRRAGVIVGLGAGNFRLPNFALSVAGPRNDAKGLSVVNSTHALGFRFPNHESMKRDLAGWLGEARDTKELSRLAEAFARSVIVSFDEDDLRDCAKRK